MYTNIFEKKKKYSPYIIIHACSNTYAIYIAMYKNGTDEIHNFSVQCMHIYGIYIKYIQHTFSAIFQHIFISMWGRSKCQHLFYFLSDQFVFFFALVCQFTAVAVLKFDKNEFVTSSLVFRR